MSSASTKTRSGSRTKSTSTKRKSTATESPVRTSTSTKKTKTTTTVRARTPSRTRSSPATVTTVVTTAAAARKTPTKRKSSTGRSASQSKKRKEEEEDDMDEDDEEDDEEEEDGEEDEDEGMEEEEEGEEEGEEGESESDEEAEVGERNGSVKASLDHAGLSIRGISAKVHHAADVARERVEALVPQARDAAQHAREGIQHARQTASTRVSEARNQLQHARETVDKAVEDVKEQVGRVVRSTSRKGKQQREADADEEEHEDDNSKAAAPRKRGSNASQPQRRSSRLNAQPAAAEHVDEDDEEVTERNGVQLRTHKADVSHLTQYHPDGTVIQSWRDVLQVLPHLLLHIAAIVALHVFIASVEHDTFAARLYEYVRPRTLRNMLLSRESYFFALKSFKAFMIHYPAVLAGFFATTYFFRASIRSILLRHADTTLKDCDYHSGAFTGYFSRAVFGVVHMLFVYVYWQRFTSGTDILDLSVVFWINLAYWAQDSLANAVYRSDSQTNIQVTASYMLLWTSLIFAVIQTPVPSWLEPWYVLLRPTALIILLLAVFIQSLMSASHLIHAHSDCDSRIKIAAWGFVFVVFIPLTIAFVIVPALASYTDIVYHYEFPLRAYLPGHYKYTEVPHRKGDPAHKGMP